MQKKGLDTTFLHYGIRREDISLIEALCTEHQLDFDWVKEDLLKTFHKKRYGIRKYVNIYWQYKPGLTDDFIQKEIAKRYCQSKKFFELQNLREAI